MAYTSLPSIQGWVHLCVCFISFRFINAFDVELSADQNADVPFGTQIKFTCKFEVGTTNFKSASFFEDDNLFLNYTEPFQGDYPKGVNASSALSETDDSYVYATYTAEESETKDRTYKCEVVAEGDETGSGTVSVTYASSAATVAPSNSITTQENSAAASGSNDTKEASSTDDTPGLTVASADVTMGDSSDGAGAVTSLKPDTEKSQPTETSDKETSTTSDKKETEAPAAPEVPQDEQKSLTLSDTTKAEKQSSDGPALSGTGIAFICVLAGAALLGLIGLAAFLADKKKPLSPA